MAFVTRDEAGWSLKYLTLLNISRKGSNVPTIILE